MKRDCNEMGKLITGYVDRELDSRNLSEVETHLGECPSCRERYESERQVKELLRERTGTVKAPTELRNRIRRRLQREAKTSPSIREFLRTYFAFHPGLSMATAVALLLLVSMPAYFAYVHKGDLNSAGTEAVVVDLSGEIVCIDCAVMLRAHANEQTTIQRLTKEHERGLHQPGILTSEGKILGILRTGKGLELLEMPSHSKNKVKIRGVIYPQAQLIEVRSYQII